MEACECECIDSNDCSCCAEKYKINAENLIKYSATVQEIIDGAECPLALNTLPNTMGINLVSVDRISWKRQTDDQLHSVTIHFIPTTEQLSS